MCVQADVGYVMWNDEFPGGEPPVWEGVAHAKGVLGMGRSAGFYLLHSVPKFPSPASANSSIAPGSGLYAGIAPVREMLLLSSVAP